MIVVPQVAFRSELVAIGDALPPVREVRELAGAGATEVGLLDLDGMLAADHLPSWLATIVAIAGGPVRFDGRLHDGAQLERIARAGFASVVVDQQAVFEPMLLRWALDLFGPRIVVEVQVDGEYVFDPPASAFGRELVDVVGDLHLQGVRRLLYRDVTGGVLPLGRLQELGDRAPGLRVAYQGPVRSVADVVELATLGAVLEAVVVDAHRVLGGSFDLAAANLAAAAGGEVDR